MAEVQVNLVVIRSADIERAALFYRALGLPLERHKHGNGPQHYAADLGGTVFEIYPRIGPAKGADTVRLGFRVASIEAAVAAAKSVGGNVLTTPQTSEWGLRAVM